MSKEEILIKECIKLNVQAQRQLYEKYAPKMRAICIRYVTDPDDAKDILQEGFIKVFSKIEQYRFNGSFEGWIKKIIVNQAIDHFNRARKKKHLKMEEVKETELQTYTDNGNVKEMVDRKDYPDEFGYDMILKADITQEELKQIIDMLPDHYRFPFNMYFIDNYTHKEISELLQIDEATSRTRLSRAKKILKKELYAISINKICK